MQICRRARCAAQRSKAACRGRRPGYSRRCELGQGAALAGLTNIGCRGAYGVPRAVHALAVWAVLTGKRLAVMCEGWPGPGRGGAKARGSSWSTGAALAAAGARRSSCRALSIMSTG